jgi:hypothetical protein
VVYFTGTNYAKALANGTGAQNAIGIADVNNKRVISFGKCALLTALSPGAEYFLSTVTAGALTAVQPSFNAVSIGTGCTTTELLINIESIPTGAWTPMFIQGAFVSPGTAPATQFNISTGKMRDLSNAANCSLNVAITNATIASNTASGGSVPAALFPITTANAGAALHIFLAFKADGVTAYAAVDNQLDGSTILADATLSAAGYIYVRRIDSTYCPANGTIRPIARAVGGIVRYQDAISSYFANYTPSTTPAIINLPMPDLSNVAALAFVEIGPNTGTNNTCYTSLYGLSAASPVPNINYFDANAYGNSGNIWANGTVSNPIVTAGQCYIVSSGSNITAVNITINVNGWIDDRSLF